MHSELKRELKQFERELSVLVARFLKIYDELAEVEEGGATEPATKPVLAAEPTAGFTTDYLSAYA